MAEDSLKTLTVSMTGIGATWVEWLPFGLRIIAGILTVIYLFFKIHNELKK